MEEKNIFVVFTGTSGFPYGLASNQRIRLLAEGLRESNCDVTVINKRSIHSKSKHPDIKAEWIENSVKYIYPLGNPFRDKSFLKRNINKIRAFYFEIKLLIKLKKKEELDVIMLYSPHFIDIIYHSMFSKLYNCIIIFNSVEYRSKIISRRFFNIFNDYLLDNYAHKMVDGVLPISEYLLKHINKGSSNINALKVPVLVDKERFSNCPDYKESEYKHFLFCGAINYFEIIQFLIESFSRIENEGVKLVLVVNGKKNQIDNLNHLISDMKLSEKIAVYSNLTNDELNLLYLKAIALLIPLRPTIQDKARFPHKIGEYLLSGRPIICTNYGEVKYYLKDNETAFIASAFDVEIFYEKMKYVLENPELAFEVGANGRKLAIKEFNHVDYGKKIYDLILELKELRSG